MKNEEKNNDRGTCYYDRLTTRNVCDNVRRHIITLVRAKLSMPETF